MPEYKAPLRDISFVMNELLESEKLYQTLPGNEEATTDLMNAIVEEGAKFSENVLSPLNQSGDEQLGNGNFASNPNQDKRQGRRDDGCDDPARCQQPCRSTFGIVRLGHHREQHAGQCGSIGNGRAR